MNSIVRPILIKKLLKNGICESVNSASCIIHRQKVNKCKLKKRRGNTEKAKLGRDKLDPNRYLVLLLEGGGIS